MTRAEADQAAIDQRRAGYTAYVFRYSQSVAIGLPDGYAGTAWEIREAKLLEGNQ